MMSSILHDTNQNSKLLSDGYIRIPNLLNIDELDFFKQLYKKWHPNDPTNFFRSFFSKDDTYKQAVEDEIIRIIVPKLADHFNNFSCSGAMFVVKPSGPGQDIQPHQDWSFVDETKYWSLNMWLPLIDVDENNGTITFVKGSHKFLDTYRGSGTPEVYSHLLDIAAPYFEPVPLNAGESVFFFHNILHGSTYNKMQHARVCIGVTLTQKDAPVIFYHKNNDEETTCIYKADETFYIRFFHNQSKVPEGTVLLEKKRLLYHRLDEIEFIEKAEQAKRMK